MSVLRSIYHIARADFRQRTRSRQFLAVLLFVVSTGYLVNVGGLELVYTRQLSAFQYETYYGRPTAAWIGLKTALTGTFLLTFVGFFLVKNTLDRETRTGMDALVPSMAITDRIYLLGKWLSNLAVCLTLVSVLAGATVVMHAINGVGPTAIVPLVWPLLLLAVPLGCVVSGLALLFETIDPLAGSLGNGVYFVAVLFVAAWGSSAAVADGTAPAAVAYTEPLGYVAAYTATYDTLLTVVPVYADGVPVFGQVSGTTESTFTWTGGRLPAWVYPKRIAFVIVGLCVGLLGTVPFDRFAGTGGGSLLRALLPVGKTDDEPNDDSPAVASAGEPASDTDVSALVSSLTPVADRDAGGLGRLVTAEARIALAGRRRLWYVGAFAVVLLGVAPIGSEGFTRTAVASVALLWPVFLLSETGVRTRRHQLRALVVSSSHPVGQLAAEWIVGAAVLAVLAGGVAVPLALAGNTTVLLGYVATVVFVPSFALVLGSWTGTARAFEAVYLPLWFVGPVNDAEPLDFAATTDTVPAAVPAVFTVVGVVLLAAGLIRRARSG